MPYEGCKGGGYDKSSLIRPPYYQRQLANPASSEQFAPLPPLHDSLQFGFRPVRCVGNHGMVRAGRHSSLHSLLAPTSHSIPGCATRRRYESYVTTPVGRTFSSVFSASYVDYPQSLMYGSMMGRNAQHVDKPFGRTSADVIGGFSLTGGKARPDTCPPASRASRYSLAYDAAWPNKPSIL